MHASHWYYPNAGGGTRRVGRRIAAPPNATKDEGKTLDELTSSRAGESGKPVTTAAQPSDAVSGMSSSDLTRRSAHLGLSLKMWLDSAIRKMVPQSSLT